MGAAVSTESAPHAEESVETWGAAEFDAIYRREIRYVWNFVRYLGVRPANVEDVAHDVFVTVFRRLSTYDTSRPLRPWVTGVAYRVSMDHLRLARHRREKAVSALPPAQERRHAQPSHLPAIEAQQLVHAALDKLDEDRRGIVVLHELEGYTAPEISEMLDVPLNTVYSRLRRGRQEFVNIVTSLSRQKATP